MNADIAMINQLALLLRETDGGINSLYKFHISFRHYPINIPSVKICALTFRLLTKKFYFLSTSRSDFKAKTEDYFTLYLFIY